MRAAAFGFALVRRLSLCTAIALVSCGAVLAQPTATPVKVGVLNSMTGVNAAAAYAWVIFQLVAPGGRVQNS